MSDQPSTSAAADDFIHLVMDRSSNSLGSSFSSSKSQYSQVVFHNLSEVYPTDGDITFAFSFQQGVLPMEGDRVALYKVGWSSVSEFSVSKFVKLPEDGSTINTSKITFAVEDLPKDEDNMYQFCYITCGNFVAGSSIPFTFRKPQGSELVAVEDPNDSGLIVFRSRVTQLQEELLKVNTENELLDKTNKECQSEIDSLKSELKEKNRKCYLHKESMHEMTVVIHELNLEKQKLMEQLEANSNVQQKLNEVTEAKGFVEGDLNDMTDQMNSLKNQLQEKVAEIELLNQKLKEQLEANSKVNEQLNKEQENKRYLEYDVNNLIYMQRTVSNQVQDKVAEIESLNQKLKEQLEANSNIKQQLNKEQNDKRVLEADLNDMTGQMSSLKIQLIDKEEEIKSLNQEIRVSQKLSEMDEEVFIKNNQIRELEQKIKEMTEKINSHKAESLILTKDLEKASHRVMSLENDVRIKDETIKRFTQYKAEHLIENLESVEAINSYLSNEVQSLQETITVTESENGALKEENKSLMDEKKKMAERILKLNDELMNLKQNRQFRNGCHSRSQEHQPGDSNRSMPRDQAQSTFDHISQIFNKPLQHLYEATGLRSDAPTESRNQTENTADSASTTTDCRRCLDLDTKIKSLLVEKADVRSELIQTKHSLEERNKDLKEVNEVAAALKSRISVLELELRKAKEVVIFNQGEKKYNHMYGAISGTEPCLTLSKSSTNNIDELKELKKVMQKEVETKNLLQRNVEALMLTEARNHATIEKFEKENARLSTELNIMKDHISILNEMRRAFNDIVSSKEEMTKSLQLISAEKEKLEKQLIELMKESVGKVSLSTLQQIKDENEKLKKLLADKECSEEAKESVKAKGLSSESSSQEQMKVDGFSMASASSNTTPSNPFTH